MMRAGSLERAWKLYLGVFQLCCWSVFWTNNPRLGPWQGLSVVLTVFQLPGHTGLSVALPGTWRWCLLCLAGPCGENLQLWSTSPNWGYHQDCWAHLWAKYPSFLPRRAVSGTQLGWGVSTHSTAPDLILRPNHLEKMSIELLSYFPSHFWWSPLPQASLSTHKDGKSL